MKRASREEPVRRLIDGGGDPNMARLFGGLTTPTSAPGASSRVWQRLDRSPRNHTKTIALAFLAMGLTVVSLFAFMSKERLNPPPDASLTAFMGPIDVSTGHNSVPAQPKQPLKAGDRLKTGGGGRAFVSLARANLTLGEKSDVVLLRLGDTTKIALARGEIWAKVEPQTDGQSLTIDAGLYLVRVVGTLFSVTRGPADQVVVRVEEGRVEVRDRDRRVLAMLARGQTWSSEPAGVVLPVTMGTRSPPAPRTAKRPSAVVSTSKVAAAETAMPATYGHAPPSLEPVPPSLPTPLPQRIDQFQRGNELQRLGRYAEAVGAYASLAGTSDSRASIALYEVGRIKHRHLHDLPGALAAFDQYRHRYPEGALHPEATLSRIEILLTAGKWAEAEHGIHELLESTKDPLLLAQGLVLRGHLRRERGDCAGAMVDYASVKGRDDRWGGDALFFSAVCQITQGTFEPAKQQLRDYLQRHAQGRHRARAQSLLEQTH